VTAADGTASVRLAPGNYTVESDRPAVFQGREYQWTQTLDVPAGRDVVLELTAANAEAGATSATPAASAATAADPADVLTAWQRSVVALWTPTAQASGFVIDARGLLATNQQVVGTATSVEVELAPAVKVLGRVLAADPASDVAVLWIDPAALAAIAPVPLGCGPPLSPALVNGQPIVALGHESGRPTRSTDGRLSRVASRAMLADFSLDSTSTGGPVFAAAGHVVGLTSLVDEKEGDRRHESRVVRVDAVCQVVALAEQGLAGAAPPSATPLPIEPPQTMTADVLAAAARKRAGSLSPYRAASANFNLAFLTPVVAYAGLPSMEFSNWTDYVSAAPTVLLVRVTPKQVENFWTKVARGAVRLQGVALPPITHVKSGFARLRAWCGDTEVTPIHPFLLERRISEREAVYEGLYVFNPSALGPHCGAVAFDVFSDQAPAQADRAAIDAKVIQQIWQDFAPSRELQ
jgi:S1-C subfamily serine protease